MIFGTLIFLVIIGIVYIKQWQDAIDKIKGIARPKATQKSKYVKNRKK